MSLKILVADDDDGIRRTISDLLRDFGYEVLEASTEQGIHEQARNADLWVIDARLPSSGYEGILAVFTLANENVRSSRDVLFMSVDDASFAKEQLEGLERLGIKYQWLDKPFEHEYLLRIIQTLG